MSNNDPIRPKTEVWLSPPSGHFAVCSAALIWGCQYPVSSFLSVDRQARQWQPQSAIQWQGNCNCGGGCYDFLVPVLRPLNGVLGSMQDFFVSVVQVLASDLQFPDGDRGATSLIDQFCSAVEVTQEVCLESVPPLLPTIWQLSNVLYLTPFCLRHLEYVRFLHWTLISD